MKSSDLRPGEEWVGALVPLPSYVTGEGEPYRPVAVMWVDVASSFIVDAELVHPDQALARAAGLFIHATREPKAGPPHTPARLRVDDATLAEALRGSIGAVELVVAPTPEIDEIVSSMTEELAARDDDPDPTFLGPDMTPDDVGAMFAAAARLFRAAPWKAVPADVCLGVRCDLLDIADGAMVVVGQLGQSCGFSLFPSLDHADAFFQSVEAMERGEETQVPEHLMFAFDSQDELSEPLLREIAAHGWDVASSSAYPSPRVVDPDLVARSVTRTELHGITAIMTALADLVETEPQLATAWDDDDDSALTWNRSVPTPAGPVEVELHAPVLLPSTDDDNELSQYAEALLAELDRIPGIEDGHRQCADLLISLAWESAETPFLQLTPTALHQILFELLPANTAIEPDLARYVIDSARFLMEIGADQLDIAASKDCLSSLEDRGLTARLERALADETQYSPTKAMILEGMRSGHDLSSEEGVAAWLEQLEQRGQPDSDPAPRAKSASSKSASSKSASSKSAASKPAAAGKAKPAAKTKPGAKSAARPKSAAKSKPGAKSKPSAKTKPAAKSKPIAKSKPAAKRAR